MITYFELCIYYFYHAMLCNDSVLSPAVHIPTAKEPSYALGWSSDQDGMEASLKYKVCLCSFSLNPTGANTIVNTNANVSR